MTFLTVQDLDNFELLVTHCETHSGFLKLRKLKDEWRLAIVQLKSDPRVFYAGSFGEVVQQAADELREAHDRAVTHALTQPLRGPNSMTGTDALRDKAQLNTAGLQGVPPEYPDVSGGGVPYPSSDLLSRTGMHAAAAEAKDLACKGIGDHIELSDS